jgi:hypothetical protein
MPDECKTPTVTNPISIEVEAQYAAGSRVQRHQPCKQAKERGLARSVGAGQQSYPAGIEI